MMGKLVFRLAAGVAILVASLSAAAAAADAPESNPFAKAIGYAQPRCVRIYGAGIGREHGYATGLSVSPRGDIVTAQGIYLAGERLRVALPDGRTYDARVQRVSQPLQAVLLKIDAQTPQYFELPDRPVAEKGDWLLAVSNAFKIADRGEDLSVGLGVVAMRSELDARHRTQDVDYAGELLLFDAITSNPGAPGGAVVTVDGRLAGMLGKLILSTSTKTRLNYAIPADQLRSFVAGTKEETPAGPAPPSAGDGKPYVGIQLFKLSGPRAPPYIDRVSADSPASKAGLKPDDLILSLGGTPVRRVRDCESEFAKLRPGEETTVVYKRKTRVFSVQLKVEREAKP
jgi:serine protease Do